MAGAARFDRRVTHVEAGNSIPYPVSPDSRLAEFATDGRTQYLDRTIPAGESVIVWAYAAGVDEEFKLIVLEPSAYCWVSLKVDKPTASDDLTPLTTHVGYPKLGACSNYPLNLHQDAPVHDDPADYMAQHFEGDLEAGKVYEVRVHNPGTASLRLRGCVIQ